MSKQDNNRIINKNDIILFAAVIIPAFFALYIYSLTRQPGEQVRLTVDGEVLTMLSLDENQEYIVENAYGRNVIVINDNTVYVSEADCPDGICMDYKPIDETGETIICLPHRLVIELIK